MKEKLIIRNFGPIKSVELDLGRFNILIGEQATGKSTVAKVLAVCRYFSYVIGDLVIQSNFENSFSEGLGAWGLSEYLTSSSYIYYECKHYSVTVDYRVEELVLAEDGLDSDTIDYPVFYPHITALSQEFKNVLIELDKIKPEKSNDPYDFDFVGWTIPISFFKNNVSKVIDNPFYLPVERGLQSIFSLGKNSIQNISDSLFNQFAQLDQIIRVYKNEIEIEPLGIVYKNIDGYGHFKKKNENSFQSLYNAASGYQSTIPVVLLIKYYTELRKKNKTFIIEEPELNLFPYAQDKLMQFLVDKTVNYDNSILITTHSPYILTSLNNMMYAYQIGKIDEDKTSDIIDKRYWINPEEVSAYMMKADGTAANIIDLETMQIIGDRIDEVSTKFNKDYDAMLDIKYAKQ